MAKRICVIMGGLPGSGKSTLRHNLLRCVADTHENILPAWTCVATDDEVEAIAKRLGKTYSEVWAGVIKEAEATFWAKLKQAVEMGDQVIFVDRTNLTQKGRKKIMDTVNALSDDFIFVSLHVYCHSKEAKERRASRVGKEIPEDQIEKMRDSIQAVTYGEGFAHIWAIDTTSDAYLQRDKETGELIRVARHVNGKWPPKYIYERLEEILLTP